jgi:hypothetical protein
MSHWKRLFSLLAAVGLAACGGGGGNSGTPGVGPTTPGSVSDIVIVLASQTIANTGNSTVDATITVVDANRNGIPNAPVTVAVDANAVVSASSTVTGASGSVVATIGIGSDASNRDITLTVTSGSVTKTAVLKVVPDATTGNPTADDLSLVLSSPSLTNGGSTTIVATATAVDRNRNVIAGIPVTFAVDSSATAAVSGTKTNDQGVVTANVGIGSDRSNRVITVTATSGNLVRTASFSVTGAKLTVSASPLVVAGSPGNVIEYTLVDFNAIAMVDQVITVTGNGLPTVTGRTDLNGKYRYTYTAPAVPTTLSVVATSAGDQREQAVTVSAASSGVAPASEVPQSASVTPTPTVVTVNSAGSSSNQVEVRALFIGANNKPVPRIRVRFDLAGNPTNTDGVVNWVGAYAYSDENGVARATFTPGTRASPTNGVTIRACYDTVDFGSVSGGDCTGVPKFATATLTVSAEALSVNIRTNELIKSGLNDLTYIKEYVVMVVDSSGQAKPDVQITPSVDLTGYYKGFYSWNGDRWVQNLSLANTENYRWTGSAWTQDTSVAPGQPVCPNEDINRNGVREAANFQNGTSVAIGQRGEDLNWNGDIDPRKADVAIKMVGSSKTDANGLAIVQIEYGRSVATWVDFVITVTASGVSGTESRARYVGNLYGLGNLRAVATAVTNEDVPPPFVVSPYGRSSQCTNAQ